MNNKTKSEERKDKIRKILPLLWNSYEHMYNVRKTNIQNSINFLLIVTTFLPIISVALYTHFDREILFIPTLFQVLALLILLKSFFIKGQMIPWFEIKETLQKLKDEDFEAYLFATLKAAEEDTLTDMVEKGKIIRYALNLLIFSLFSVMVAVIFVFFNANILFYVLTIIIAFFFSLLYVAYYRKAPDFNFQKNYENYKEEIDKWLKDGEN